MKNLKRILTMAIVLSLMFTITAFADDTDSAIQKQEGIAEQFETVLEEQVSAGTITQEEADALIEYLEENKPEEPEDDKQLGDGEERPDMFEGAVEEGIITQDQADAISEGIEESLPEMPEDGERPEMPEDGERPEMPADGERPEMPPNGERPEKPE